MTVSDSSYEERISEACDDVERDPSELHRTIIPVAGMFWPQVRADMNATFDARGSKSRV